MTKFIRLFTMTALAVWATTIHGAIITVNTTNNISPGQGETNLFYAISLANTNGDTSNTIRFDIPGTGVHYIKTPTNGYPLITNHNITIDGYSQPGSAPNSNPILAPNNAKIKIVLDSRIDPASTDFLGTDMDYAPGAGNTGFGAGDVGMLGLFRATNFHAQGLCFLGQFSPNYDMYCVAIACDLQGTSHHAQISGCWFGVDVDGTNVVGGCVQAIANLRHRDNPATQQVTSDYMTVGVKAGSANPRAEFNVMLGMIETLGIEGSNARISGNFLGVFPDGLHDYIGPRDGPDIGDNWRETHIEIGRANNNTVIGSDLDGVNDADERNIIGGVVDQTLWVAATGRPRGYTHVIEFYGNNNVINGTNYGPGTNIVVAGNYFGVGIDGATRFTIGVPALDGTSPQVRFENNVVFNNYPTNIFDPALAATRGFFDGIGAANIISARKNKLVNNYPFPAHPQKSGGFLTNYYNKALLVPTDANGDVFPVLSTNTTLLRLAGKVPIANTTNYPTTIIDLYVPDPEGITNGMVAADPDLPNGWVQGLTYLGSFVEGSTNDLNPAAGQFEFDISKLDLKGATRLTITANYSKSPATAANAVILTSPFSEPYTLPPFIPGGAASVGLTNIVADTILWFDSSVNRPKLGGYVSANAVAPGGSVEPYAGLLGDSTFLLSANTYADDGASMRFAVVFQPATGGAAKIGDLFYDDRGQAYTNRINESRQDGNPGRVAGDPRPGATTFMGGGEVSLWNYPSFFNSDGRFDAGSPFYSTLAAVNGRDAAVQTYSLNPATLVQTMLSKAQDSAFGRCCTNASYPQAGNNQISRFGGHIQGLDNGNFVSVVEDRSGIFNPVNPASGHASVATVFGPTGTIVKEAFAVDNTADQWANVAAFSGGFCVRPSGDHLYFFNNAGTPQFTNSQNASSGLSFDTGRGDGTRIASDIRSHYVYLAGVSGGQVWLAIWNAQTGAFVTKAVVSDGDPSVQAFDRVNLAVDAWDRVCVVFKVRPVATDFPVFQTAARVLAFDGTNVSYLTHSFFPFVNHDESGTLGISTIEPTVAMTSREIFIAAKGIVNSTNNPSALGNTGANTDVYTIVNHPDPKPTPGGGPLVITNIVTVAGQAVTITWTGGNGPYLLQMKSSLTDLTWQNVLTTQRQSESVALQGGTAFFRVSDNATNTVTPFTAFLSGDGERPQVTTGATGLGSFSLEGNTLTYNITFSGLSAPATAAHIHGSTNTTGSIGVIVPFSVPAATSGTISGSTNLSDTIKASILSGLTYANIHNTNHSSGEIRGQIGPTQLKAALNGANERPTPVVTSGTGSATLTRIGNQLLFNITYSGLTSAATAAHIHGRADTSGFAGVLVPLPTPSGTSGTISGSLLLDNATLSAIVDGLAYVNIHTSTNPDGEIRGQITP